MHEMSVALEICRIAEDQLGIEALASVVEVGVEVGDRCGLEPANLEFCLEALLHEPPFCGATARILRCPDDTLRVSYLEVDDDRSPN